MCLMRANTTHSYTYTWQALCCSEPGHYIANLNTFAQLIPVHPLLMYSAERDCFHTDTCVNALFESRSRVFLKVTFLHNVWAALHVFCNLRELLFCLTCRCRITQSNVICTLSTKSSEYVLLVCHAQSYLYCAESFHSQPDSDNL